MSVGPFVCVLLSCVCLLCASCVFCVSPVCLLCLFCVSFVCRLCVCCVSFVCLLCVFWVSPGCLPGVSCVSVVWCFVCEKQKKGAALCRDSFVHCFSSLNRQGAQQGARISDMKCNQPLPPCQSLAGGGGQTCASISTSVGNVSTGGSGVTR